MGTLTLAPGLVYPDITHDNEPLSADYDSFYDLEDPMAPAYCVLTHHILNGSLSPVSLKLLCLSFLFFLSSLRYFHLPFTCLLLSLLPAFLISYLC